MKIESLQVPGQEMIALFRSEARRYGKLADDLQAEFDRSGAKSRVEAASTNNGNGSPKDESYLSLAYSVLLAGLNPMHITAIVKGVAAKKGGDASRNQVESALVRGMKSGKYKNLIKRAGRATFVAVIEQL